VEVGVKASWIMQKSSRHQDLQEMSTNGTSTANKMVEGGRNEEWERERECVCVSVCVCACVCVCGRSRSGRSGGVCVYVCDEIFENIFVFED